MSFIDLETKDNKEIYNITHINNAIVNIEPPRKIKNIPQCSPNPIATNPTKCGVNQINVAN